MCGIVGYLGPQNPKDVIIAGLKKLEYRGYDSAGVAILHQGHVKRIRASGKLKELEDKLISEPFDGHIGIGHTRWATHGVPSERNAHPHQVDGISLVHNGIIENYLEIREELLKDGAKITSDTDTELVAHLIAREVNKTKNLEKSVLAVLKKIYGAFSILVMWDQEPDLLMAFKDGPPLVVGVGEGQSFIASDVQAVLAHTQKFIYLEDREVVKIKNHQITVMDAEGKEIKKPVVTLNWSPEQVEKQGYKHFMLKEIFEQPRAVAASLEPHVNVETHEVKLNRVGFGVSSVQELETLDIEKDWQNTLNVLANVDRVFIVACGTSFYAATVAKYYIERLAKVPVELDIASEFRYRFPVIPPKTLVITISQSGETADTLAAIRMAKQMGAKTLSVCNVKNSTIDREAHGHMYLNSGTEVGVASTKAFVGMLSVMNLFSLALAKAKKVLPAELEKEIIASLLLAPSQMEGVLAYDKYFMQAAKKLKTYRGFLYMGRGVSYPISLEGALKMKELAYVHAEGYAAGEMKHGPLALIDERMMIVVLVPADELYEKTISNLQEVKARGGKIISIGTGDDEKLKGMSEHYLSLPKAHWTINPILSAIPLQLMAYHLASNLGYDVDQPRNLAKSVTVE